MGHSFIRGPQDSSATVTRYERTVERDRKKELAEAARLEAEEEEARAEEAARIEAEEQKRHEAAALNLLFLNDPMQSESMFN